MSSMSNLLSTKQVAKQLGISVGDVKKLVGQGVLHPKSQKGDNYFFSEKDILEIRSNKDTTISEEASLVNIGLQRKTVLAISLIQKIQFFVAGILGGYVLLVAIVAVLFIYNPLQTARFFGYYYRSTTDGGLPTSVLGTSTESGLVLQAATEPERELIKTSVIADVLRPVAATSLIVVKAVDDQVYERIVSISPGSTGLTGSTGSSDLFGEKGEKGETGSQGLTGPQGLAGTNGSDGTGGSDGADGSDGTSVADVMTAAGDVIIRNAGNATARLAAGLDGQVLTITSGIPSWEDATGGSVIFSDLTGGTNLAAAMLVGTGASLDFTGSGTINASTLNGLTFSSPGPIGSVIPSTGAFTSISSSGDFVSSGNFSTLATDYLTTGVQNDVDLGAGSLVHYNGISEATFTGIAGGTDGRLIRINNVSDFDLSITNLDTGSAVGNRILTSTGDTIVIPSMGTIQLQYNSHTLRWHIVTLPASPSSIGSFAFLQDGNAFGADASLGTTDAYGLNFITGGNARFGIAADTATLTGTGATTFTSGGTLALTSAAGSGLTITSGTTGAITIDSETTGGVNIGTGAYAKSVTIGNASGATDVNLNSGTGNITFNGDVIVSASHTFTSGTGITIQNSDALTLAANDTILDMTGTGILGLNTTTNRAITTGTGMMTLGGNLTISGDDLFMSTNTSGALLVADGTNFNPVLLGGEASIDGAGALTINYASAQSADATHKGFLTALDWNTFNSKQAALGFTPENIASKSTDTNLGTSDTLYPSQNAVKTYVDNYAVGGLIWQEPIENAGVIADTDTPEGSPVDNDSYIINTGGDTGAWSAFAPGDLVQYQTDTWVKIKSLVAGDRFGVAFSSSTVAAGSMSGKDDYLAQVTGGTAGAFTYTFTAPADNYAVFDQDPNSYHYGVSFTYTSSLGEWVALSAGTILNFGSGVARVGNNISIGPLTVDWEQTGAFDINTAGDIAVNGGTLSTTSTTASLFNTDATTLNIGGAATTIGLGAAGATVTGGGALTINSGAATAITLDSGTTGSVNLGTGDNAKTINFGTGTAGNTINIGTDNNTADTIAIGSALDAFSLASTGLNITTGGALTGVASIDTISTSATAITFAGAGTLSTTTVDALTIDSGTTGAVNLGTGSDSKVITIGNTTGTTGVTINSGSAGVSFSGNTTITGVSSFTTGTGIMTINGTSIVLAGNSTVLDMTGTGVLGINTTTNRGITFGTGAFTMPGNYATPKGTDYSTTGVQNDVDFGTGSLFHYAGADTATFTGIAGGTDGRLIRVVNTSAFSLTINNQDANSLAANRIITLNGANVAIPANSAVEFVYDSGVSRWRTSVLPISSIEPFIQSGNGFGATAILGTTDAFGLNFITSGNTRFGIAAGAATLTGTGATTFTSDAGSALTIDSGTTGALNFGTGANAKTIAIGNTTGTTAVNINSGTGNVNFTVGPTSSSGKVQIGNSATTTPDLLVLDNGTADPAGTNGASYYNTSTNKFRCYENSAWKDCDTTGLNNIKTSQSNTSASLSTTETSYLSVTIIPTSTTKNIWITGSMVVSNNSSNATVTLRVRQGSDCTGAQVGSDVNFKSKKDRNANYMGVVNVIGSPSTTSAVTYQFCAVATATISTNGAESRQITAAEVKLGADLAEVYNSLDATLEPGEVVVFDGAVVAGAKRSEQAYQNDLLGVVSTNPGMVLSGPSGPGKPILVALSGRVPVNVSTENGAIEQGDSLTSSSIPGVAMKATNAGATIGTAMTSFNGEGVGTVVVFVKNGTSLGNNVEGINTLMQLLGGSGSSSDELLIASQEIMDSSNSAELTDKSIIEKNLIGYITRTISDLFKDAVEFFGKVIFHSEVSFLGRPTFNSDSGGFAEIKAGALEVIVNFDQEYENIPIITGSPDAAVIYAISDVDTKGFKIKLSQAETRDIRFGWTATAISDAKTFVSTPEPLSLPEPTAESEPTTVPEASPSAELMLESEPTSVPEASPSATATQSPTPTLIVSPMP